jgi:hypothetical protein
MFIDYQDMSETIFYKIQTKGYSPHQTQTLADIFSLIETNKVNLNIESYSISQTTLEQIFMSFANKLKQKQRNDSLAGLNANEESSDEKLFQNALIKLNKTLMSEHQTSNDVVLISYRSLSV